MAPTKTKTVIIGFCLFFLSGPAAAVQINELGNYQESDYGPEYFYAISGTVTGQAAPGIESIYVNGRRVALDSDLNFTVNVHLGKGQKHLIITSRYHNLRFTRKYLVIRHPQVKKPFVINVPKQEFQKMIEPKPKQVRRLNVRKAKKPVKLLPVKKPVSRSAFVSVRELAPGKMFVIRRVDGKYFGALYVKKNGSWFALDHLRLSEFQDLLK